MKIITKKALPEKKALHEAGEERIELPLTVLETAALPLYYSPMSRKVTDSRIIQHAFFQGKQNLHHLIGSFSDVGNTDDLGIFTACFFGLGKYRCGYYYRLETEPDRFRYPLGYL